MLEVFLSLLIYLEATNTPKNLKKTVCCLQRGLIPTKENLMRERERGYFYNCNKTIKHHQLMIIMESVSPT